MISDFKAGAKFASRCFCVFSAWAHLPTVRLLHAGLRKITAAKYRLLLLKPALLKNARDGRPIARNGKRQRGY